jgi:hypothetical protein
MRFQSIMLELNNLATIALLLVLAACIIFRRLRTYSPVFFAYAVYACSSAAVTYSLIHFGDPYWAWYGAWIAEIVGICLEFAALIEVFNRLFAPYEGIRRFARLVLLWALVVLTITGSLTALLYHEVQFSVPILTIFLVLERSLRAVELGMILVFFALSKYLHLRWKNLSFGIALGFGFYDIMALVSTIVRAYYGKLLAGNLNALTFASYWITVLIWIFYVLQPDVIRVSNITLPSPELERWDRALSQLLKRSMTALIS